MIYGWDISTSIIGLSRFDADGKFIDAHHLDLRKIDGQLAKADEFKKWLADLGVNGEDANYHFIEERLGNFASGKSMLQTLMKLAQFNAICSYIIWTHDPPYKHGRHRQITYLHPSTWKSIMKREGLLIPKGSGVDKKEITLAFVRRREPSFHVDLNRNENPQPWCYDRADAWCIGKAGFYRQCSEKES